MKLKLHAVMSLAGWAAFSGIAEESKPAAAPQPPLVWSSEHLETTTTNNQGTAEYRFGVTNGSDAEVVIDHVKPSCTCTTATMPSQPWHLLPHTGGEVKVSVNLFGKSGTFDKTVGVYFADSNTPPKFLRVTVKMPNRQVMRDQNSKLAQADRQAVFKGDCAVCHAEPAKSVSGHALYRQVCGICHDARPRASAVPDLHLINHPTDYDYWRTNIANGKPGTMMPAFAAGQGGPLSDAQIDDLARDCLRAMPYIPRTPAELGLDPARQGARPVSRAAGTNN